MEKFAVGLFFVALVMAIIFWLPDKLGLGFSSNTFCLGVAFVVGVIVVVSIGARK